MSESIQFENDGMDEWTHPSPVARTNDHTKYIRGREDMSVVLYVQGLVYLCYTREPLCVILRMI